MQSMEISAHDFLLEFLFYTYIRLETGNKEEMMRETSSWWPKLEKKRYP